MNQTVATQNCILKNKSAYLFWPESVANGHTDNQIYANVSLHKLVIDVAKNTRKFVPLQQFIGLQVIDTKGSLVGNVKDISLDFETKDISFKVATKNKGAMDFGWDDIQSVEDVVLLKRQVEMPAAMPEEKRQDSPAVNTGQPFLICPTCGASSPTRAKFCSKCGADLKS